MADEAAVTKKDLQSLMGWVNAKLTKIETRVSDLERENKNTRDGLGMSISNVQKDLNRQIRELQKRLTKLEEK